MPLTTEVTRDYEGIIHTASGVVTGDELVRACHTAFGLVQNTRNFQYEVVDLSRATGVRAGPEHLDEITVQDRLAATYRPDAVVVIIAPRDDAFLIATTWEQRVRDLGWHTFVTRVRAEGLQWLRANFPPVHTQSAA